MGTTLNSLDNMITSARTKGLWKRAFVTKGAGTSTAANTTSGYTTAKRFATTLSLPSSFGASITGALFSQVDLCLPGGTSIAAVAALEFVLQTLRFVNITFTVNTGTDRFTCTAHGCSVGDALRFTTSGSLPAPLATGTDYFVNNVIDANTFTVSTTKGGGTLDITTTGSGTQTVFSARTDGVTMPTRIVGGSSIQTATLLPMLAVTSALTATTPAITITYTDQDANTGNTASLTLPSNAAVESAFCIAPHLASGDTGVQAATNLTASAGTAGTMKVMGLLPIGEFQSGNFTGPFSIVEPLTRSFPIIPADVNDAIAFYSFGGTSATDLIAALVAVADY